MDNKILKTDPIPTTCGETTGINMTQATTTNYCMYQKYNRYMESYTTSKHNTNTSTACDTSSIKFESRYV